MAQSEKGEVTLNFSTAQREKTGGDTYLENDTE
jgi:hypothetical protein